MLRAWDERARAAASGVALIDLMLVVTILGILTAVAVQTTDSDELALDATVRALAADLHEAQTLAIQTRIPFGLKFDVARNRCEFALASGNTPVAEKAALRLRTDVSSAEVDRLLAARASGEDGFAAGTLTEAAFGGQPLLVFQADGSPVADGLVQVDLDRSWLRIRVQAVTGRITVTGP